MNRNAEDSNSNQVRIKNEKSQAYDKYANVPKQYMEVAEGIERQFTNHLLTQMQKSAGDSIKGVEKLYRQNLNSEYAKLMSESSTGVGIKDVVLRDIVPNFNKPNRNNVKMYQQVNSQKGERNE
jgi:Rod binding domain-containing protein